MFADGNLTDVLRNMGNDSMVEQKIKNSPSMRTAASLYKQQKSDAQSTWRPDIQIPRDEELEVAKRKSKEEARRKAKEEAELKKEEKKKREGIGKFKPKRKSLTLKRRSRSPS